MILLLIACFTHDKGDSAPDSSGDTTTDSADSADTADSADSADSGAPYDCGPTTERPALPTDHWGPTGDIPGGGIVSFVSGPGGTPLYAGSHNSGAWSSASEGDTWTRLITNTTHTLADLAISPDDPNVVYRSSGGILYVTTNGGGTWTKLPLGVVNGTANEEVWSLAVASWDSQRVYGVTDKGQSYLSTDAGASFTPGGIIPTSFTSGSPDPFDKHAWHLLPEAAPGGRVIFSDSFGIFTSDDELATWQLRFASPMGGRSLTRDPTNPSHLLEGAQDGLLESFDEGSTWAVRDVGTSLTLGAWADDGSWLAYASADTLYVSEDKGETFTEHPLDWVENEALTILGDERLVMSWDNGVVISDDRGETWTPRGPGLVDPGMAVIAPHPVCADRLFIASRCSGGIYHSTDWGSEWTHVEHYFHYVMSVHYDPHDYDHVWAVSDDSLLESRDGGVTWADVYVKYHFHAFAVSPLDADTLLLGSVGSGEWADTSMHVLRSTDGGKNWADSSTGLPRSEASAHSLVYWPDDPTVVLLATYKGGDVSHQTGDGVGLYRSTDGGASWALSTLPEVNIAWLAPTANGVLAATGDGVWRTTDKGVTWEQLTGPSGYMLSVDAHDQLAAALSQSGHVWVTRDGGDTWTQDDTGLPSNPTTWLAQIAISADNSALWATVFEMGVYRIGL